MDSPLNVVLRTMHLPFPFTRQQQHKPLKTALQSCCGFSTPLLSPSPNPLDQLLLYTQEMTAHRVEVGRDGNDGALDGDSAHESLRVSNQHPFIMVVVVVVVVVARGLAKDEMVGMVASLSTRIRKT